MFISASWPAPARIRAYTTLRKGGQSAPPYHAFNLGFQVGDPEANVKANRKKLQQLLTLPADPIWLKQVHGKNVVEALPKNLNQEADSVFTRQINHVCAILTADCLPILLCNQEGTVIAAIHAGWRGLANGILKDTVQTLKTCNSKLLAWLGPAIGPEKFEVGKDVYSIFTMQDIDNQKAFLRLTDSTWLANIYELARIQLFYLGVSAIYGGEHCTYTQENDFFSYRRDRGKTGRMATLIWIEG